MNLPIVNVKQLLMKQEEVIVFIIKHKMKKSVYEIIIGVHSSRKYAGFFIYIQSFLSLIEFLVVLLNTFLDCCTF